MGIRKYLPRTSVDAIAMTFTIVMAPVAYLHGVFNIAPIVFPDEEWLTVYYLAVGYMTFLLVNTVISYWRLLTTDTSCGRVALPVVDQPGYQYCPFCQYHAPPRSHHCPICRECVLRRDHHCYFTGKCIGYYNHRYFITFLVYVTAAALLGTVMSFWAVFMLVGGFSLTVIPSLVFPLLAWLLDMMPASPLIMVEASIAMFATIGAGGLLVLQLYQATRGQTYYEFSQDITTYKRNFAATMKEIMGENWWICWLSPVIPSQLLGNGAEYQPYPGVSNGHPPPSTTQRDGRRKLVKDL